MYPFRHLESSPFRVLDVQSHFSLPVSFWVTVLSIHIHWHCTFLTSWFHAYSHFPHFVTMCLSPIRPCSSRFPFSLLMTMCFEFTIHISVMLLSTLHLLFPCGSRRTISFQTHSFLYSRVVRPSLIFVMVFRVTFRDVLEGAWFLGVVLETFWDITFFYD